MADSSTEYVALGDLISLYCVDTKGYVYSYDVSDVQNGVFMHADQNLEKPESILDSSMYQFRICIQNRYKLGKKYRKLLKHSENNDDPEMAQQLKLAKAAAEAEEKDNVSECKHLLNQRLLYGDVIQLQHVWSKKYVHISTVTGSIKDQDNMLVYLSDVNSKTCRFRISPRYKVKSDGDTIQPLDHVMFESVKMPGHYLHASKSWQINKFSYGSELNMGIIRSGFIMSVIMRPTDAMTEMLRFGDSIQLYHRELESHLLIQSGFDETPSKDSLYFEKKEFTTNSLHLISESGCKFWTIEDATCVVNGQPIRWGQSVVIRHRITHHYLCLDESMNVSTTKSTNDPRAVFNLRPVKKEGEWISRNSLGRIQHELTGYWLRTQLQQTAETDDLAIRADDVTDDLVANTTLAATEYEQYHDAFMLLSISQKDVLRFNYVAGLVPFFATFNDQLMKKGVMRQTEKNLLVLVLKELYEHFQAENEGCETMHSLLRNFKLVDSLLALMKFPPPPNPAARQMVYDVMLASYVVMQAYLNGQNRENAEYLFKDIKFFYRELENPYPMLATNAALTLTAMLTNNRRVLGELEETNILYIVDLVKRNRDPLHLDILAAMCVCQERGLMKNQVYMAENLINFSGSPLYRFAFGSDCDQRQPDEVYLSRSDSKWEKLTDFVLAGEQGQRQTEYLFLIKQLRLMERICYGSNTSVIKMILKEKQIINWKIMFNCLKKTSLPGNIRAAFCRLIEGLCVLDGTSVLATDTLSMSFEFDIVGRSDPIQRKGSGTEDEAHGETIKMAAFVPLRKFVVSFLQDNAILDCSHSNYNELISEVVKLADAMLNFGYFGGRDDLQQLIAAVVAILDGRTDIPRQLEKTKRGYTKRENEILANYQQSERFQPNSNNTNLINVKIVCLKILDTVFKYQYHATLHTLIHKFKTIHSHAWVPKQTMGAMLSRLVELDDKNDTGFVLALEEKLGDIFHKSSFFQVKLLTDILFDISNYEHEPLMIKSIDLLNLLYTSDEKLFNRADNSQVLLTEESRRVYRKAQEQVPMIRLLTAGVLDDRSAKRASRAMHEITKSCILKKEWDLPHCINQKIYINHGLLSVIYDLLTQYASVELRRQSRTVVKLLRRSLLLLSTLCNRCPQAQKRTFHKLDLLLQFKALSGDVGVCLEKIFYGNEQLCLNISAEKMQQIVSLAGVRREKASSVVAALQHMIQIESQKLIIPRNQDIVMKAIMHDFHNVAYVLDKSRDVKVNILLGKFGDEHRRYLLTLVNLLATAAEGENILIESLCQKYVTLDETLVILNHDGIDWHHKSPYLRFLDTAYMNTISSSTETGASELAHSTATWEFMERIVQIIENIIDTIAKRKDIIDPLLSMVTSISGNQHLDVCGSHNVDKNDQTEKLQYKLRVYFFAIVPFLERFMSKFFERDDANFPDEIQILDRIARKSLKLAEEARPCISNQNYMKTLVTGVTCVAAHSNLPHQEILDHLMKIRAMTSIKDGNSRCVEEVEYLQYYQTEVEVNEALSIFNKNLSLVYCGTNTIQSQLAPYINRKIPKTVGGKEYTSSGPEALPLGPEFHQFVMVHIDQNAKTLNERYRRALKLIDVMSIRQRANSDEDIIRVNGTNLRCLHILRAIIHNEIIFLPDDIEQAESELKNIREIQNTLVRADVFYKLQWLMGCANSKLAMEVPTFFSKLFFNANKEAQTALMTFFKSCTEEVFFQVATDIINNANVQIREIRSLHLQREKQKCMIRDPTLAEFLIEEIRFFSPKNTNSLPRLEKKKVRWWYTKKKKEEIRRQRTKQQTSDDKMEMETYTNSNYDEDSVTTSAPDYSEVMGNVSQILLLVGQACDGQNEILQDYMREQPDNVKSYNLVSCTGYFLANIYTTIGCNTLPLITQIIDTMNELASGNQPNQRVIQQSKIVDQVNFMLRSGQVSQCGVDAGVEFLDTLMHLLRTVTEENDPDTNERSQSISLSLDINLIVKIMTECYAYSMPDGPITIPRDQVQDWGVPILPELGVKEQELRERLLKLGFHTYFFIQKMMEHNQRLKVQDFCLESRIAWNYFQKKSMSVELVKDGFVNRCYFRVENQAILRRDVMEIIRWDIDRSSYNSKIRDLMSWRRAILQDMKYQRKLMKSKVAQMFMKLWLFSVYVNLLLSTFLCGIILYDYSPTLTIDRIENLSSLAQLPADMFGSGVDPLDFSYLTEVGPILCKMEFCLIILHVVTSFMVVVAYFLRNQPYLPDVRGFIERTKKRFRRPVPGEIVTDEADEVEEKTLGTPVFSFTTLYYLIFLGCSLAGLLVSSFFFSFHLFNIISINQILKRVIRAVTQNGVSLLWVTVLGLALLFVYTLIIYVSFRGIMDPAENWYCDRMYKCFVTVVRYGLIGDLLDNMPIPEQDKTFERFLMYVLLNLSFFILITTIGLNIVFGIIVDTFSELRDLKWTAEKDMNEVCPICDIEAYEFDNKAKGFWYHISKEHSVWGYMFYFLYLSETSIPDYTSIELSIHTQLVKKQTEFFPKDKSLSLMEAENDDEDKLDKLVKHVEELVHRQNTRDAEERRRREEERRRTWGEQNRPIYAVPRISRR